MDSAEIKVDVEVEHVKCSACGNALTFSVKADPSYGTMLHIEVDPCKACKNDAYELGYTASSEMR